MFNVKVIADNKESRLKKGEVYTVFDVYWHIQTSLEGGDKLFFLIYNPKSKRFMYELCINFKPAE